MDSKLAYLKDDELTIEMEVSILSIDKMKMSKYYKSLKNAGMTVRHTFENISSLNAQYSETVVIGELPWYIHIRSIFSKETDFKKYLSVAVCCNQENISRPGWSCEASVKLKLFKNLSEKGSYSVEFTKHYNKKTCSVNYVKFISWEDLMNQKNGYIKDDRIIIEAEIDVITHSAVNIYNVKNTGMILESYEDVTSLDRYNHNQRQSLGSVEIGSTSWSAFVTSETSDRTSNTKHLIVWLRCDLDETLSSWACTAKCAFWIKKHSSCTCICLHNCTIAYSYDSKMFGIFQFLSWNDLMNPKNGYIDDDEITIRVDISIVSIFGTCSIGNTINLEEDEKSEVLDATIEVENRKFYVMKEMISMCCPVIKERLFLLNYVKFPNIVLEDVNPDEFLELLNMIQGTKKDITASNVDSLLKLANQFKIDHIVVNCHKFLMSPESGQIPLMIKILYADFFSFRKLMKYCLDSLVTLKDFQEVHKLNEFSKLSESTKAMFMEKAKIL